MSKLDELQIFLNEDLIREAELEDITEIEDYFGETIDGEDFSSYVMDYLKNVPGKIVKYTHFDGNDLTDELSYSEIEAIVSDLESVDSNLPSAFVVAYYEDSRYFPTDVEGVVDLDDYSGSNSDERLGRYATEEGLVDDRPYTDYEMLGQDIRLESSFGVIDDRWYAF